MSRSLLRGLVLPLLLSSLLAACAPTARLHTPAGFAVLEDQKEFVYRATSADGVVIAIRSEPNKPLGNLDFWADVLDRKLRNNKYVADGKVAEIRSASGLPGRQLKYTREEHGRTYRYWVAVFVTAERVWMVEAGGDKDRFAGKVEKEIQKAIDSFVLG
jgi:hypothetical protein